MKGTVTITEGWFDLGTGSSLPAVTAEVIFGDWLKGEEGLSIYVSSQTGTTVSTTALTVSCITVPTGRSLKIGDIIIAGGKLYRTTAVGDDTLTVVYCCTISGGGGEPDAYIKSASVSDNTLTLVKQDGTTVELDMSDTVTKKHSHDNKSVLDTITSSLLATWNTAASWVTVRGAAVLAHLSDAISHITAAERTAWNAKQDKLIAGTNIAIADDGKTISATGGSGGGISDAPSDGAGYIRRNAAWANADESYRLVTKVIVGYSLTTEEPSDWTTAYTSYYTKTGTGESMAYTAVTGDTAPAWATGTYYSKATEGVNVVDITTDMDGDAVSLSGLLIRIAMQKCTATKGLVFYINPSGSVETNIGAIGSACNASWIAYSMVKIWIEGGVVLAEATQNTNYSGNSGNMTRWGNIVRKDAITGVRFKVSGTVIPPDSSFIIYGR